MPYLNPLKQLEKESKKQNQLIIIIALIIIIVITFIGYQFIKSKKEIITIASNNPATSKVTVVTHASEFGSTESRQQRLDQIRAQPQRRSNTANKIEAYKCTDITTGKITFSSQCPNNSNKEVIKPSQQTGIEPSSNQRLNDFKPQQPRSSQITTIRNVGDDLNRCHDHYGRLIRKFQDNAKYSYQKEYYWKEIKRLENNRKICLERAKNNQSLYLVP